MPEPLVLAHVRSRRAPCAVAALTRVVHKRQRAAKRKREHRESN